MKERGTKIRDFINKNGWDQNELDLFSNIAPLMSIAGAICVALGMDKKTFVGLAEAAYIDLNNVALDFEKAAKQRRENMS
jgi:hypothetical protein